MLKKGSILYSDFRTNDIQLDIPILSTSIHKSYLYSVHLLIGDTVADYSIPIQNPLKK